MMSRVAVFSTFIFWIYSFYELVVFRSSRHRSWSVCVGQDGNAYCNDESDQVTSFEARMVEIVDTSGFLAKKRSIYAVVANTCSFHRRILFASDDVDYPYEKAVSYGIQFENKTKDQDLVVHGIL